MFNEQLIKIYINRRFVSSDGNSLPEIIISLAITSALTAAFYPTINDMQLKAKQEEASITIDSLIKASQGFYSEFGILPRNSRDLSNYTSIKACCIDCKPDQNKDSCNKNKAFSLKKRPAESWNTPSGHYSIKMIKRPSELVITARPTKNFRGYGVSACFSGLNGISVIKKSNSKSFLKVPNCRNYQPKIDKSSRVQKGEKYLFK